SSPNPNTNIYHNTVRIEGAAASGANPSFGYHRGNFATSPVNQVVVDIKNNIFDNARTGGTGPHCAIGNYFNATTTSGANWTANASNYNLLNSADPNTVGYWQTAQSINGWRTASQGDGVSISGAVLSYTNPAAGDLHINPANATPIESSGTPIASVTVDFDGQTRANFTPVDIGADAGNFIALDLSVPQISYTALPNTCSPPAAEYTLSGVTISDFTGVPTTGNLVPRIYFRKNAGAYVSRPGTLTAGTGTNGTWSFPIVAADLGGLAAGDAVSYFVIAQDLAPTPNIASNPAGAVATDVNTVTTPPASPNVFNVYPLFSGTYNVGAGGTYTTLTAAVAAYNNSCLTGPVTFLLTDANYSTNETFPIVINQPIGASATNTLLIKPAPGVNATISGTSATAIITLNGADFVTIDGSNGSVQNSICPQVTASRNLTIINNSTSTTSAVVWLQWYFEGGTPNSAQNNRILNCNIVGNAGTTTLAGVGMGSLTISSTTLGFLNNNNHIINNNVQKVQIGIFSRGQSAATKNTGNRIE
ncbi:MAG TPA: hypothetical protein PKD78_13270, partial [Saprospiraceae bacterium]|nr:hypothetical protein [Saprospiraceae bacterium]